MGVLAPPRQSLRTFVPIGRPRPPLDAEALSFRSVLFPGSLRLALALNRAAFAPPPPPLPMQSRWHTPSRPCTPRSHSAEVWGWLKRYGRTHPHSGVAVVVGPRWRGGNFLARGRGGRTPPAPAALFGGKCFDWRPPRPPLTPANPTPQGSPRPIKPQGGAGELEAVAPLNPSWIFFSCGTKQNAPELACVIRPQGPQASAPLWRRASALPLSTPTARPWRAAAQE